MHVASSRLLSAICFVIFMPMLFVKAGVSAAVLDSSPIPNPPSVDKMESGVDLGGIGAGSIRVTSDGAFSHLTINNNWLRPSGELPGCFGAVSIRSGSRTVARVIALHSGYGLPVVPTIKFDGAFPQATLRCTDDAFPDADVTLRAFSPFIPGDVRNSSLPAAAFVFQITNRSGSPITVTTAISWENTLGAGDTTISGTSESRTGDIVSAMPDSDGFFGMRFSNSMLSGGSSANEPQAGSTRDMALMAHPYRNSAVVTTAGWNTLDSKPAWWESFASAGLVSGTALPGVQGKVHPAGVIAVQVVLKPREKIDVPMCISWFTPVLRGPDGREFGHYYAAEFSSSSQVARTVLDNWQPLLALTDEWQRHISSSTLPVEADLRIINSASPLITNSIFTRDGRFTLFPDPGDAPGTPPESYLSLRRRVSTVLLALFPQLYAQEMVSLLAYRMKEGEFPPSTQDWAARIGTVPVLDEASTTADGDPVDMPSTAPVKQSIVEGTTASALTDAADYVEQADMLVAQANDLQFLRFAIPSIRSIVTAFQSSGVISKIQSLKPAQKEPVALGAWLTLLRSSRRLARFASVHAFEWAGSAGPLGSAPGGLMEFATDQHFVEMCDAEIAKVDTEMSSRGVQQLGSKEETSYQTLLASAPKGPFGSAMDWNLLSLVEGFEIDLQSGDLDLFTPIPGDWRSLAAPVFSASFIGQTEYRPSAHGGLLTLRIDRTVTHSPIRRNGRRTGPTGVPELTIRRMRIAGPPPIAKSSPSDVVKTFGHPLDVHVGLGPNTIGCTVKTEATGTLLLAFDSPLTLHTGDLLQIVVQ